MGPFARADVATRLLRGLALPEAWAAATTDDARWALIDALAGLLGALRQAGARHPDLNVRNILILDAATGPTAAVLDVDRVVFGAQGDVALAQQNLERLLRSMRKARVGYGVNFTSRHNERLRTAAGAAP
jgi:hypothetical protein